MKEPSSPAAAATLGASGPVFPSVATPAENFLGAGEVGIDGAGCGTARTGGPVGAVDLPQAHIVGTVGVVEFSVRVAAALSTSNALATALTPACVLRAGGRNVYPVGRSTAMAGGATVAWAVASTGVG